MRLADLMEATVKLTDLYDRSELEDESEILYHHLGEEDLDRDFVVHELTPEAAKKMLTRDGETTVVDAFRQFAGKEQKQLVRSKAKAYDHDRIIVVSGRIVLDGNHQLMAGIMAKQPIKYIDVAERPVEPA